MRTGNSFPIKHRRNTQNKGLILSDEQSYFVDRALEGHNILVDACIGSGKTTAIQQLCNRMPDKSILYLTYNKLLKLDAKSKIKSKNVMVTNYHGFVSWAMIRNGIPFNYEDSIQQYLEAKPSIPNFDVLMIDEYQDIEQELADLLEDIKSKNPEMQIIAVGDMEQKIYDKTTLNVPEFISHFLGDYLEIEFTKCFRLSNDLAEMLGRIWEKEIIGINNDCDVSVMSMNKVVKFLKDKEPKDVLCLGSRSGDMTKLLNKLEEKYPETYNKKTVYASIRSSVGGATEPKKDTAVFTTFDSCKGMEKPICVVFDWTISYWQTRLSKPSQSFDILRNIFCVAASRGKNNIIFVGDEDELLTEEDLVEGGGKAYADVYDIDGMFDFKYREDIDRTYELLNVNKKTVSISDSFDLNLRDKDEMIDLLPCISLYQMASYFVDFDIDDVLKHLIAVNSDLKSLYNSKYQNLSLEEKILFIVSLLTNHNRYVTQVSLNVTNLMCHRIKSFGRSFTVYGDDCGLSLFRYYEKKMNVIFMINTDDMFL